MLFSFESYHMLFLFESYHLNAYTFSRYISYWKERKAIVFLSVKKQYKSWNDKFLFLLQTNLQAVKSGSELVSLIRQRNQDGLNELYLSSFVFEFCLYNVAPFVCHCVVFVG